MPLRRTLRASIPDRKDSDMDTSTPDRNALGHEARKLLEVLLLKVEENGSDRAQVSTARLLKDTGLTEGALLRARNELTQGHLLRTQPGFSSSGLRGANVYVLNLPVLDPPKGEVAAPEPTVVEPVAAPPVEEVLEGEEESSESSRQQNPERKRFLGFFRRSGVAS